MSSNWSQEKYIKTFRFAAELHNDQRFPGTDWPYIVHLSMVCMEIMAALAVESNVDGDLAIQCALLHDSIEDAKPCRGLSTDEIKAALKHKISRDFGKNVIDGVLALTKDDEIPDKHERMLDSLRRIKQQPKEVWMVKMADRVANLQPPPEYWSSEKCKKYLKEAGEIHDTLKGAGPFLSERLSEKMKAYRKYCSE